MSLVIEELKKGNNRCELIVDIQKETITIYRHCMFPRSGVTASCIWT